MSVCPGCGRCRQCGYPAPVTPYLPRPWYGPYPAPVPPFYPTITSPNTTPYYVGDVLPGSPGYIEVTC